MIYLDNGATSFPKPRGMIAAMEECLVRYCGNPGRSGHFMSLKTGEEVYKARRSIGKLFNIENSDRLLFTKNTTEALNLGIHGLLKPGDHVITTTMEHNSVLRPLKALEANGITQTVIRGSRTGLVSASDIEKCVKRNTRLIVVTAASNVTGTKQPIGEIGKIARRCGAVFMVDGAQGAGSMDLNVKELGIDMLAFPGHKGLLGPLGTGCLYVSPQVEIVPIIQGGTGTESKSRRQPCEMPEGFEAGTINAPAIIGMGYSAEYINKIGIDVISQYEEELITYLEESLKNMDFVMLYGPEPCKKTGISLFNIKGCSGEEVTSILNTRYGIAVRGGYHCAGLAHKTIGTWDIGAVRVSVGPFNSIKDIDVLVEAIRQIGKEQ